MKHDLKLIDDEFIDLVYASLLGETSWQHFLDRLAATLPDGKSTLFYHDQYKATGALSLTSGMTSKQVNQYDTYFCRINPWMPRAANRKIGIGVTAEQMLPYDRLVKTEFYSDFLVPAGAESAVGVTIVRTEGRSFLLSILTSERETERTAEAAELLTRLAPHLNRVFKYYQNRSFNRFSKEARGLAFDAIDVGLIIVGDSSRIKSASETAQKIMEQGNCVRTSALGKLHIASHDAEAMLQKMLDRTSHEPKYASFQVDDVKVTLIHVQKDRFSFFFEGPTVVVILEPQRTTPRVFDLAEFREMYALTGAEVRALNGLIGGRTADEIAAEAGLSRETIRSQIKSLYAKTNAANQVELIRMVAGLEGL
ncbi:helix-turn-helix transcriptional regulator [Phyllobacterium sp. SYP-B3895]|uniref:Helix-turn-helix transcriptional regulator n=1 Tax=Phyllobacterium pellucidum TaxID=2740464 RepID=A0A849VYA5_9HYPH|nr:MULTISPECIES: helix-turn-helix transcriptional regulator [Phyllobacterium]MRG58102.1 helix-turn-helix transcriptional regulator [Phyllobacterium sp. SYP-B3895]NTS33589.1 helix-turn-helix transcriptional regulator [Phyllobacterium pellucidum]SFJ46198.1 DNA-binding transcriptional regulator, CsgD family [Phyllobacterium sp. CL33Tsu]